MPRPAQQDGAEERVLWNLRKKANIKQDTETVKVGTGGRKVSGTKSPASGNHTDFVLLFWGDDVRRDYGWMIKQEDWKHMSRDNFILFFAILGLHPQHMEVPRLQVELELHLWPVLQLTATLDP